jgi:isopropylmalate/homocitrate/citramalate synthase
MTSHNKGIVKRSKEVMTLSSKIELLDKLSKGESVVSVANHYHINDSTVQSIKKSEGKIQRSVSESAPIAAKICSITHDVKFCINTSANLVTAVMAQLF